MRRSAIEARWCNLNRSDSSRVGFAAFSPHGRRLQDDDDFDTPQQGAGVFNRDFEIDVEKDSVLAHSSAAHLAGAPRFRSGARCLQSAQLECRGELISL